MAVGVEFQLLIKHKARQSALSSNTESFFLMSSWKIYVTALF